MKFLTALIRRSPFMSALAALIGGVTGIASTALLALVNKAVFQGDAMAGGVLAAFFGLCLLVPATNLASLYLLQRLGQGAVLDLRRELSRQVLATPLARLERLGAPRLLSVLTEDVNAISNSVVLVPLLFVNGAVTLGCLAYLAWMSPKLFAVLLGLFVFGALSYQGAMVAGIGRFRKARLVQDQLFEYFRGLIDGAKELILHEERQASFLNDLDDRADEQCRLRISANMILGASAAWGQLLVFVVIGGLLLAGPRLGIEHQDLSRYVLVLIFVMSPLQACLNSLSQFGRANVAVSRIEELGFSLAGPERPAAPAAPPPWRELRFSDVTYSYTVENVEDEPFRFQLGPVDLALVPGEMVFLVGGNGSGKTSLAKLLLGLYAPDGGEVSLDGEPVTDENRPAYRSRFSAVFTDFFLFDKLYGMPASGLDALAGSYLEKLQLENKVKVAGGVLSTTALSQGQRKRLALLTAYLEDREIYLFDEWAADQDPIFKDFFYEVLLPELKSRGKTVIAISHDEKYYGTADRLVKLDYGRVVFDGPAADYARTFEVAT